MIYISLLWVFCKISLFSFGGGHAMIPLMQTQLQENGWVTAEEFYNLLAIAEATPGPLAVNAATFAGWQVRGFFGAAVATTGVCLPGFVLLFLLGALALRLSRCETYRIMLHFLRPALAGLIIFTAILLAKFIFREEAAHPILSTLIFGVALAGFLRTRIHPIYFLLAGGVSGLLFL